MPELVYFDRIFAETKKCNGVISMHKEQECPTPMILLLLIRQKMTKDMEIKNKGSLI